MNLCASCGLQVTGDGQCPTLVRIMSRLDRSGECWIWTKALDGYGYAQIAIRLTDRLFRPMVHRVVYEHLRGEIPAGLQLDHLCRVRSCANPEHLEPVTNAENTRRGTALLTVCRFGHPLDMVDRRGWRRCRTCHRTRTREWMAAARERRSA